MQKNDSSMCIISGKPGGGRLVSNAGINAPDYITKHHKATILMAAAVTNSNFTEIRDQYHTNHSIVKHNTEWKLVL
jgi:hypothetical protein